jgi:hypothetical protein
MHFASSAASARHNSIVMQFRTPEPDEALRWFTSLSAAERARFLAALAHNLTIAGRCFLNAFEPAKSDAIRARAVNELLHKVTSYLQRLHSGDEDLVWAPVVSKQLLEQDDLQLRVQVWQAWHYAMGEFRMKRAAIDWLSESVAAAAPLERSVRMMKNTLIATLWIVHWAVSATAIACSCRNVEVSEALEESTTVVVARVVSTHQIPMPTDASGKFIVEEAAFEVMEPIKGAKKIGDRIQIRSEIGPGPCGRSARNSPAWLEEFAPSSNVPKPFPISDIWLIFAYGNEPYELSMCTRSSPMNVRGAGDLEIVRKLINRSQEQHEPEQGDRVRFLWSPDSQKPSAFARGSRGTLGDTGEYLANWLVHLESDGERLVASLKRRAPWDS